MMCASVGGIAAWCILIISNTPTADELEALALEQRRAIRSAHLVWSVRGTTVGGRIEYEHHTTLYWSVDKGRRDRLRWTSGEIQVDADQQDVVAEGVQIAGRVAPTGSRSVTLRPDDGSIDLPDPRVFGMAPSSIGNSIRYDLESFIGRADRGTPSVSASTLNNVECWKVEYERNDGNWVRYWIAPEMDYSVIRIEVEGSRRLSFVETELLQEERSGIWFPHRYRYQYVRANGEVDREQYAEFTVKSLNEGLDPSLFTLAGMDIPRGTRVIRLGELGTNPPGLPEIWDGSGIVLDQEFIDAHAPQFTDPAAAPKWYWMTFSLVGLAIALVALLLYTRRPRES